MNLHLYVEDEHLSFHQSGEEVMVGTGKREAPYPKFRDLTPNEISLLADLFAAANRAGAEAYHKEEYALGGDSFETENDNG